VKETPTATSSGLFSSHERTSEEPILRWRALCGRVSNLPETFTRPTKPAPDAGDSAPFYEQFLHLSLFHIGRHSAVRPLVANSSYWLVHFRISKEHLKRNETIR
jgi:hypothetical protein